MSLNLVIPFVIGVAGPPLGIRVGAVPADPASGRAWCWYGAGGAALVSYLYYGVAGAAMSLVGSATVRLAVGQQQLILWNAQ